MNFNFGYNGSCKDILYNNILYEFLHNALYIKALSSVTVF